MASILDIFTPVEVLNYVRNRTYPTMLGEQLFPAVKRPGLKFEYLLGANNLPVSASVHAFDTEAEVGDREAQKAAIELALIKRKIPLREEDIIAIENPRNDAEYQYMVRNVFNDVDNMVNSVRTRIEAMRMEIVGSGMLNVSENNLNLTLDYGVPITQKENLAGTSLWTDGTSDPIGDMSRWADTVEIATGVRPTRAITSSTVVSALLKHPQIIGAMYGTNTMLIPNRNDLNNLMTRLNLPIIATYDAMYRKQATNGTYTSVRYFQENKFTMLPPDGVLGETIYGPTPEESRLLRNPAIQGQMIGNICAVIYDESKDPVSTWTKASAVAMPSFPIANEVFIAQVI
jgi:hypothetical protein